MYEAKLKAIEQTLKQTEGDDGDWSNTTVAELVAEIRTLQEALKDVLSAVGPCNDEEKARGRCAGHPMLTRLPCLFGEARKLVSEATGTDTGDDLIMLLRVMRACGWAVAVHNDYRQNGEQFTFWLFTHPDGRYVKGEGRTDAEAIRRAMEKMEAKP